MRSREPDQRDTPDSGVPPVSDGSDDPEQPAENGPADPYQVRAKHLLNARTVPVIVGSIMLVLITVFYIGSVVDPVAHLGRLPVSIVDQNTGASVGPQHVDLGAQLQSGLTGSRTVSTLLALTPEWLPAADGWMNRNGAYTTAGALRWKGQIAMAPRGRDLHLNVPLPRKPPDLLMAESPPTGGLSALTGPPPRPFCCAAPRQSSHAGSPSSILLRSDSNLANRRSGAVEPHLWTTGRALRSVSPSSPSITDSTNAKAASDRLRVRAGCRSASP